MLWADPVQVNPQPSSLNPKPQSPNPKPQTLKPNPQPKRVQGWVDHQFAEHIPNGEFIAAGSHDAIFDRSVTSFGLSVYALCSCSAAVVCAPLRARRPHVCRRWRACKPRIFGFANAALDHFLERNGYCGILRGHMGKQYAPCFAPACLPALMRRERSGVQIAKCGRVLTVFSTSSDHHQSR